MYVCIFYITLLNVTFQTFNTYFYFPAIFLGMVHIYLLFPSYELCLWYIHCLLFGHIASEFCFWLSTASCWFCSSMTVAAVSDLWMGYNGKQSTSSAISLLSLFSHPVDKSTDYPNYYQGLWDCTGDYPVELSFKRGDAIYILSRVSVKGALVVQGRTMIHPKAGCAQTWLSSRKSLKWGLSGCAGTRPPKVSYF